MEQDRRILRRKLARSSDQRFGYVHAQHMAARADAGGQSQTRRARAATDVKHAFARGGRCGFYRGLAKYRKHGVEPGLVGDPVLSALAIPVGDLIGFLLCHDISSF
ncbi:hypothetical protein D3C76_919740 [compost metagenome]